MLPPRTRGSRGSYAAQLWSGLFLHLLITAEVKPDPGKQARSAEINSPQQDKSTDLPTAPAAAFPQAQQQLPGSSPETCTQPHWPATSKGPRGSQECLLLGSQHKNHSLGFLTKPAVHSILLSSESEELAAIACSSFSILALLHCTARGMLFKHSFVFPTSLLSAHLQYKQALSFIPKHSQSCAMHSLMQFRCECLEPHTPRAHPVY